GSKGSAIGGVTKSGDYYSGVTLIGDRVLATQDVTSMTKPNTGISAFYTQLYLISEDYKSTLGFQTAGKKIQAEPVGSGITIKATRSETSDPFLDTDKMDDAGYEGTIIFRDAGAGIRSVKITGPNGTTNQTFYAPAYPNNMAITATTVSGGTNPTPNNAIIANPYFSDSTKYFSFTPTVAGKYSFVVTDHLGNISNINNVEVKKADLVLKDTLNGYEITFPGAIDRAVTTSNPIVVPTSTTSTTTVKRNGSTYSVSSGTSIINGLGYGIGNFKSWSVVDTYTESKRAEITKNTAEETTVVPKMIYKVTLEISWQGYEFGKDENNTGVWGSEGNPYLIQTDQHLKNLARIVNGDLSPLNSVVGKGLNPTSTQAKATPSTYAEAHFRLDNSLSSTTPIGKSETYSFAGTFNGNGNTINLSISGQSYAGLFGYTSGVVKGINVTGSVSGVDFVGGIAGYNSGTVTNCINNATITASGGAVGGVVGENYGTVEHCVNMSSSIAGNTNVGSVVGRFRDGAIQYVFDFGAGRKAVGGNEALNEATTDDLTDKIPVKGWTFISDTAELSVPTDGSETEGIYFVVPEALYSQIKPMDGETCKTTLGWDAILTNNFDGFCLTDVTVPNGQYLSLNMGGSIATPTGGKVADYTSNYAGALEIEQIEY
ncbi:MAG: hypothetical protein J6S32_04880, partial [Clostridia bacterium]|nr:hypothetical protein [Clostridia bacterium]